MSERSERIKEKERYARKVCFGIGIFGILLLILLNSNFYLMFSGMKHESKVLSVYKGTDKCHRIQLEFSRPDGELVQKILTDCTGETFLFWVEEGDSMQIWESRNKPYKHYVPFINFAAKVFLAFFFVFIPFLFGIYGRG